jgi:hypothetical protein
MRLKIKEAKIHKRKLGERWICLQAWPPLVLQGLQILFSNGKVRKKKMNPSIDLAFKNALEFEFVIA